MNSVLQLKNKPFIQASKDCRGGKTAIQKDKIINLKHLKKILGDLESIQKYWEQHRKHETVVLTVCYNSIVAKSNRIQQLFKVNNVKNVNDLVVNVKFDEMLEKHIITYKINFSDLVDVTSTLDKVVELYDKLFHETIIDSGRFNNQDIFNQKLKEFKNYKFSKSKFIDYLKDSVYIDEIMIANNDIDDTVRKIVTFYDLDIDYLEFFKRLNIHLTDYEKIDKNSFSLSTKNIRMINEQIPYLINMELKDLSQLFEEDNSIGISSKMTIEDPNENSPCIGIIDGNYNGNVYFSKWVEFHDEVNSSLQFDNDKSEHGTMVASIIVDGERINPEINDGCGKFKVRLFRLLSNNSESAIVIYKKIEKIISENLDIKVWNLSMGTASEINFNYISLLGSILDDIQSKYDIIFVISATNMNSTNTPKIKIGSPADSINSIVVASVDTNDQPATYSRIGNVLNFFIKPDVSFYGGDVDRSIRTCTSLGEKLVQGTSFAAPWIARKVAYLIHYMGLTREEAKALIIDSAINFKSERDKINNQELIGHGVVPISIHDIINSKKDEIKFIVSDVSEKYETYNYHFPIPINNGKYPYIAKGTMVYFPSCNRNQGVDYTNTELSFKFGRLIKNKKIEIKDDLIPEENLFSHAKETELRKLFRKWDNVKHKTEFFSKRKRSKNILNQNNENWGISVVSNERTKTWKDKPIRFSIVVTLKEITGANRIDDFIKSCIFQGWSVNKLIIKNKLNFYNKINEELDIE